MVKVDNAFQRLEEEFNKINQQIKDIGNKKTETATKVDDKNASNPQPVKDTVIKSGSDNAAAFADALEPTANDVGLESQTLPQASWRSENPNQTTTRSAKASQDSGLLDKAGEEVKKSTTGKAMSGGKASSGKASSGKASDLNWIATDLSSYATTVATDNEILNAYDSSLSSQQNAKKLMNLLMYLLKASESGDLNTFYQLMKVVTLIISRDRAIQNSHLVKRVILLQEQNSVQNKMLSNADVTNSEEFLKVLQTTRSEMETISMSQKLLTTMMEETKDVMTTYQTLTHNILQADSQLQREMNRWG